MLCRVYQSFSILELLHCVLSKLYCFLEQSAFTFVNTYSVLSGIPVTKMWFWTRKGHRRCEKMKDPIIPEACRIFNPAGLWYLRRTILFSFYFIMVPLSERQETKTRAGSLSWYKKTGMVLCLDPKRQGMVQCLDQGFITLISLSRIHHIDRLTV